MTKVHIPDGTGEVPDVVAGVTAELEQAVLPQAITGAGKMKLKDLRLRKPHAIDGENTSPPKGENINDVSS